MNFWQDIKDRLKDHTELAIQLLIMLLVAYVFMMAERYRIWKIPIIFVGLTIWIFWRHKTKHPILWLSFFILLILDIFNAYFWVANHHFMLIFMVLSVIFFCYHKRVDILEKNIQILLFVVLIAAALQKLTSNQFMSGEFYYFMTNRGYLFRDFISFSPEALEILKSNSESILNLQSTNPNFRESIVLKDIIPNLSKFSVIYVWLTVIVEFVVAFSILWKPYKTLTHMLFLMMILGILTARLETGFMALLAICGVFLCRNVKLRLLYVMIVIGCLTLIVTKRGFN